MSDEPNQIFLFGDQTNSFDAGIRQLSQHKDNAFLVSFFERCHFALRSEIGRLPASQRDAFPRFTSILDLLARYKKSGVNPALEGALTCIHQVACFIGYYGEGSRAYPSFGHTQISGLCTGLLAAAAISASQAVADLLPAAVEAVLISFRTGLTTMKVRDNTCQRALAAASWSVVISGLEEQATTVALKEFSQSRRLPPFSRPYISAINANSLTISGPPNVLEQVLQSAPFNSRRSFKVPIHSPYHAPHLYDESDLDDILSSSSRNILESYSPQIPVISSSTGELIEAADYGSMLRTALREILLQPFRFERVLKACTAFVKSSQATSCNLVPVATHVTQHIATALRQVNQLDVQVRELKGTEKTWDTLSTGRASQSKIAIIGLSGRFPDAEGTEAFWDLLYKGLDVHRTVPKDRFDVETHYDPTGKKKNASQVPYGCFIENPGHFDARFFNMSPKEAAQADPAQRLAIVTAYEALEMAGFVPNRTPSSQRDRVGLFYGMTSDDWREVNSGQNVDTYFIPGGNRAFTPGRINYHFKFSGPSFSVDTACSSSLAAIHMACNSLWQGDCDTALAGGTNVLTNPDNFTGLDKGHFLSRTGNCKTFDDSADGYCRSDAVGTVVLKRLEDAQADKDPIQGVILGACTNHSAEAVSITRPEIGAQAFVFDKVLNAANVDPNEVSYIEMHGTGTQAGDAVEMGSCLEIFAPDTKTRKSPLFLGSVKANVGHAESASGVTSLIKVMLMMRENIIPPHCGIKTKINHTFPTDLKERDIHIAFKPTPWNKVGGEKRKVFLNNFSAAGGNTALLLEDGPTVTLEDNDTRPLHMVAVSARSRSSLQKNAQALVKYINAHQGLTLGSLSYTSTARRVHHNFRAMVSGSNPSKIVEDLQTVAQRDDVLSIPNIKRKMAFTFTGQGSQYIGMGKQLFENFAHFRSHIKQLDSIVQSQGFPTILPIIDGSSQISDVTELSPVISQLATTCLQMALAKLWSSWGVNPTVVIGHSLGEYAALNVAGVLSASDTIFLAGKRAQFLMEECEVGTHSMLAIKASASVVLEHLHDRPCEIACINAPEETVVSGKNADVDELSSQLSVQGLKCTKLRVPFAFHSAQVEPISTTFEAIAEGIAFHKPTIPVISPLLGNVVTESGIFGPSYLSRHCRETVNFLGGLEAARGAKLIAENDLCLEIGPHSVCSGMIKATFSSKFTALPSLRRNEDTWKVMVGSLTALHLAGVDIQWSEYHRDFNDSLEVLQLPSYSWDNKNHWIQYVHDWCLTKGDPPTQAIDTKPQVPKLSTTSVQKVVEESGDKTKASIVVESDIAVPELRAVLTGHRVNGAPLCPSTLYADQALTIGDYLVSRYNAESSNKAVNVAKMTVSKPLIADKDGKTQLLRVSANVDWSSQSGVLSFYIVNSEGKKLAEHATCTILFGNSDDWRAEWQRREYMIKPRLQQLEKGVAEGESHKMKRGMAYRVFSTMVEYADLFKGFEEVTLNSTELEGTAKVKFQTTEKDGNFFFSPYWIDSLGQLTGFIMNGNDAFDHKVSAHVNHGWETLRCADVQAFSSSKTYQSYTRMQPFDKTSHIGDVYIMEGGRIIAMYGGVKFQAVPRRFLDAAIPPVKATGATVKAPVTAPASKTTKTKVSAPVRKIAASPKPAAGPNILDQAMKILAEEIGVQVSELSNESDFASLGVDSLLSLTISGKFREDLNVEVESSIFVECPSVREFKDYLSKNHSTAASTPETLETPSDSESEDIDTDGMTSIESEPDEPTGEDLTKPVRAILAEEIGITAAELSENVDLSELGMDSLMALTVTGRLREELGLEVAGDLFGGENNTVSAIEESLGIKPKPAKPSSPKQASAPIPAPVSKSTTDAGAGLMPKATSILLQGNAKTASKILWLFPDGSGSATSYAPLTKVDNDVVVYGLNCPWMKNPQDMKCSLEGLTPPYLAEVRRRQPHGPYFFGGWSAGGICAYDAAQQMIAQGEEVARLIFIDTPFAVGIEKLPPRLYDFFKSIGMFGKSEPPAWLIGHFLAFIEALDKYHVVPFAPGKAPRTHVVWAVDGVCKYPDSPRPEMNDGDPREMKWLLNNRTDFGPNGWDTLLGGKDNIVIETIEGANHFSLMEGKNAQALAAFIARSMA